MPSEISRGTPRSSAASAAHARSPRVQRRQRVHEHRLDRGGGGDDVEEAGPGRELVHALRACRRGGERQLDDGRAGGAGADEGRVARGGEEGDGRREPAEEEHTSQVEEWDGVALGHEREHGHVTEHRGRRGGGHGVETGEQLAKWRAARATSIGLYVWTVVTGEETVHLSINSHPHTRHRPRWKFLKKPTCGLGLPFFF